MLSPAPLKTALRLDPNRSLLGTLAMTKTSPADTLGHRIARLRRDRGLTQVELAHKLAVSQPVVSDYEHDVIRLAADMVGKIAAILGVSTDELLGHQPPTSSVGALKNRRLYRRLQEIEKLPKRDQEALLRTIDAFVTKAG